MTNLLYRKNFSRAGRNWPAHNYLTIRTQSIALSRAKCMINGCVLQNIYPGRAVP